MRVLLLREVPNVGNIGDIKTVSDGYGRNFLIPSGLAKLATNGVVHDHARYKAGLEQREAKERARFERLAERLAAFELPLSLQVGPKGRAFGSITAQDIAAALAKAGIMVAKHWIALEHPIKTAGRHEVGLKLPHGIAAVAKVVITPESDA